MVEIVWRFYDGSVLLVLIIYENCNDYFKPLLKELLPKTKNEDEKITE